MSPYVNTPLLVLMQLESCIAALLETAERIDWFERPVWIDDLRIEADALALEFNARRQELTSLADSISLPHVSPLSMFGEGPGVGFGGGVIPEPPRDPDDTKPAPPVVWPRPMFGEGS